MKSAPGFKYRAWTAEDDARLKSLIEASVPLDLIAAKMKRTTPVVRHRAGELRISTKRGWGMKWARDPRVLICIIAAACLHDLVRAAANLLLKPGEAEDGETHTTSPIHYKRNCALCVGDDPCNCPYNSVDVLRLRDFVLGNDNDPLTKAGGPSPLQEQGVRKGNDANCLSEQRRPRIQCARWL